MPNDDDDLVALIDGELEKSRRSELLARLESNTDLRRRYEALRATGAPIEAAMAFALDSAPIDRLRAYVPPGEASAAKPASGIAFTRLGLGLRGLAAGIVVGFLAAAALAWFAFGSPESAQRDDWRTAVMSYLNLYTNETFAMPTPAREAQAVELQAVAKKLGLDLTPETVALPGLTFKAAFLLGYEGSPLAEIAFVDESGNPVLFCVIANNGADERFRTETRENLSLATWSRGGHGFLVIGRKPEPKIGELGRLLETRV